MFGLQGFADCDGEDCEVSELLKIGLVPSHLLSFDVQLLTPEGWQAQIKGGVYKLYCPECVKKQQQEAKRCKLSVVSS